MACPIDAPVRVASSDTLKRFSALAACTPDKVIIAAHPDTVYPISRPVESIPSALDGSRHYQAQKRKKGRVGDVTVETASVGDAGTRVVRIIPTLPDEEPVAVAMPAPMPAPMAPMAAPDAGVLTVGDFSATDQSVLAMRPASYASPYDTMIAQAAVRHRVDPLMLHSVIRQESGYRPAAMSPVGARGLMQIMPGTGVGLGVANASHLLDPATNIDAGARHLRRLWDRMGGRFDLVLAAYNAGEGAVRRFGMQVPPFNETRNYVAKVQGFYRDLVSGR